MDALTLVVPTGRLFEETAALLQRLHILQTISDARSLILSGFDGTRVLTAKPADVLSFVEHGAADAGIVGKDMLLEQDRDVYEMLDLRFGACRGVVAFPRGEEAHRWRPGVLVRIATKYPRITARFFERHNRAVEIIELHGSVELAARAGLADGIMDLVMTGQTLRENLLEEVAEVFRSTARLVVNRSSLRRQSGELRPLLDRLEATVR